MTLNHLTSRQARQQLREKLLEAKLINQFNNHPKVKELNKKLEKKSLVNKFLKQKEKPKVKSSKVRKNKEWCSVSGLEFPIYMHDYKGKLITKIVDHTDMIERVGVSNYIANVIKEKRFFRGAFFSYNKHIDITQFSKPKIKLVA